MNPLSLAQALEEGRVQFTTFPQLDSAFIYIHARAWDTTLAIVLYDTVERTFACFQPGTGVSLSPELSSSLLSIVPADAKAMCAAASITAAAHR